MLWSREPRGELLLMAHRVHKNLLGHLYLFISFYIFIALTRREIKNSKRAGLAWKSSCDADVNIMLKALLLWGMQINRRKHHHWSFPSFFINSQTWDMHNLVQKENIFRRLSFVYNYTITVLVRHDLWILSSKNHLCFPCFLKFLSYLHRYIILPHYECLIQPIFVLCWNFAAIK